MERLFDGNNNDWIGVFGNIFKKLKMTLQKKKLSEYADLPKESIGATTKIVAINGSPKANVNIPIANIIEDSLTSSNPYLALSAKMGMSLEDGKAPKNSPTFTGTVSGITKNMVGLGNADNTSDIDKPISTAQINAFAPKANPIFTGVVSGVTKSMIGLELVDNTSDLSKPVSESQKTYIDNGDLAQKDYTDETHYELSAVDDDLQSQILSLSSGAPKGSYANLAALILANPDHQYNYITLDNGHWNYWNGSTFVSGGEYLSTGEAVAKADVVAPILNQLSDTGTEAELPDKFPLAVYGDASKVLADGIIRTFNGVAWKSTGQVEFPSNVATKSNISTGFRYTYWPPTTPPTLEVRPNSFVVTYENLTIVDTVIRRVHTLSPTSIEVTNSGILMVYAELQKDGSIEFYYDYIGGIPTNDTASYKPITDSTIVLPLLMIETGKIIDVLKIQSGFHDSYSPSLENDIKLLENDIRALYPESSSSPILFLKSSSNLQGEKQGTGEDIRVTNSVHQYNEHNKIKVKGSVSVSDLPENQSLPNTTFYIANSTGNKFSVGVQLDANGSFDSIINIPESTFDDIDLSAGYDIFIFIYNAQNYDVALKVDESYWCDYPGAGAPELAPINDLNVLREAVSSIDEILADTPSILSVTRNENNFGNYSTNALNDAFSMVYYTETSATTTNSESPSDGYLAEVSTRVVNGGTFVFKVGLLDQYPRFVVSRSFELVLTDGLNTIDVSALNIPIKQGEQIAISCTGKSTNGTGTLSYQNNNSAITNELVYGEDNGLWEKLATTYGGEIVLSYKIKEVDTIFADKQSIIDVNTLVENQAKQISRLQYVYDENGTPFKLAINNGQLIIKSVQYANVLALGNSLTSHSFNLPIGYHGDDSWAMASTNKVTTTWTNHLQTILRQKQNAAVVTPFNIAAWEINYMGVDLPALFAPHIGIDYDLIVFRAGENGIAGTDYVDGVDRLISYLRTTFPQADIIMTDMFWHNTFKQDSFKTIAEKYNYQYITFGDISDICLLGQMTMGVDDIMYPIIHNGVAAHCTDVCFFDFANVLANSLGYTEITGKHTLNVGTTSTQYAINSLSQIKDGYVSIMTYGANAPTIVATGATTTNNIAVTHHDIKATMWINTPSPVPTFATTFLMPDEDVVITIN